MRSPHRHQRNRQRSASLWPFVLVVGGTAGATFFTGGGSIDSFTAALPGSGCNIKGNVSIDSGDRIYHVPGQKYYDETNVLSKYGERWFCSEKEARQAG